MTRQGSDTWIIVKGWSRHQHYRDRRPPWIKVYLDLLHNEDFLGLSGHDRAVLFGLWLEYASSASRLRLDTRSLSSRLRLRVTMTTLETLRDAGFIEFSASAPLATRARTRETETEKETETPKPPYGEKPKTRARVTGWRLVRGSHGMTHVPDPKGTDRPPADARL